MNTNVKPRKQIFWGTSECKSSLEAPKTWASSYVHESKNGTDIVFTAGNKEYALQANGDDKRISEKALKQKYQ